MSAGDGATGELLPKWERQNLGNYSKKRAGIIVNRHVLTTPTKTRGVIVIVLDASLVSGRPLHEPFQQVLSMETVS